MFFRWFVLAVFAASIIISGRRRWESRQRSQVISRKAESAGLIAGRLFIALPLFGSVLLYIVNPRWMVWASLGLPSWVRWIGVGLGVLVVLSVYWVLTALGASVSETVLTKQDHRLVTNGPYQWVRHPLYTTGITLFLSIALMADNWFILLWSAIALVAVRVVVIPLEEAHLVETFGDAYRSYRSETSSLLPWPRRR
jgi:protein-S-isoprenylcysteine O-methyltransferase Ste14